MENSQDTTELKLNPNKMKVLEKIKNEGFETQNQQLIALGFTNLSQNLKYLKEYQGNFENASAKLLEKKTKKEKGKDSDPNEEKEKKQVKEKIEKEPKEKKKKKERIFRVPIRKYPEWPTDYYY